jgi:RHS repeat-associated protein
MPVLTLNISNSVWLTLTNSNPLQIQQGATYTDPGATATDVEDGTIPSASITTTGTVNTAVQGTYTLTYSVTDSGGLTTKQARTVAVLPPGNLQPTEAEVTDYYPYGQTRLDTGNYNSQRKYIGEQYDSSSDLSFLNARYYNPATGRFVSQDPVFKDMGTKNFSQQYSMPDVAFLADPQQLNSYSYARDNPINNKDTLGTQSVSIAMPLFLGIAAVPMWGAYATMSALVVAYTGLYYFMSTGPIMTQPQFQNQVVVDGGPRSTTPRYDPDPLPEMNPKAPMWAKKVAVGGLIGKAFYEAVEPYLDYKSSIGSPGGINPSVYSANSIQLNSTSAQARYQGVQNYNNSAGAKSNESKLWVTPNGTVTTWDGKVVAPAPGKGK